MCSPDNTVKLNVGGIIFQSTHSTLTKFSGFFRTMLETEVPVERNMFGYIFIDRDPTHFRVILNFMRDGDVDLPDSDVEKIQEISREANFYLLEGLINLCQQKLEMTKKEGFSPKFLDSYDQVLQKISDSEKHPLIIIYYSVNNDGALIQPNNFDLPEFLAEYSSRFDIYLKKSEIFKTGNYQKDSQWQFTINYQKKTRFFPGFFDFSKLIEQEVQRFLKEEF